MLCLLLIVFSQSAFKTDFFEIAKQIEIYNSLFKEINMNYVDKTNPAELMESGVKKMLLDLDPYTVYSSEQDVENAKMRRSGDFVGIGASLRFIDDSLTVVELYKGYAADKGGLRPGDIIFIAPISAVLLTCVPPQSSTDSLPILTTRTLSSYFSSKKASAPDSIASLYGNIFFLVSIDL